MLKRIAIKGFIEIPDYVTIGEFKAEVTGESREKQKRRGDTVELVYTNRVAMPEGAQILKVEEAPEPLFDEDEEAEA